MYLNHAMHNSHCIFVTSFLLLICCHFAIGIPYICPAPPSFPLRKEFLVGSWYEIGASHTTYSPYERSCVCMDADYSVREDGRILLVNTCYRKNDSPLVSSMTASPTTDPSRRGDFSLHANTGISAYSCLGYFCSFSSFIITKMWGYYDQFLVASTCGYYLWLIARTPTISPARYEEILLWAEKEGGFSLKILAFRKTDPNLCIGRDVPPFGLSHDDSTPQSSLFMHHVPESPPSIAYAEDLAEISGDDMNEPLLTNSQASIMDLWKMSWW